MPTGGGVGGSRDGREEGYPPLGSYLPAPYKRSVCIFILYFIFSKKYYIPRIKGGGGGSLRNCILRHTSVF